MREQHAFFPYRKCCQRVHQCEQSHLAGAARHSSNKSETNCSASVGQTVAPMKGVFALLGLALGLALALAGELQPHSGECLERHVHPITAPAELYLLAFLTMQARDSPFMFGISFSRDTSEHYKTRDALAVNNTHAVYYKVREGESSHRTYRLPVMIPDGWTTLRLRATATNFTLEFALGKFWVYVTSQTLDHDILEVYFEEAVALCSGLPALAAWQAYGTEVTVPLQPLGRQWVEVTAGASATPYFKLPGETDKHSIPPNTTVEVFISQPLSQYTTVVSKDGEELARSSASNAVPKTLVVGGASHVRLSLSPPLIPADALTSHPTDTPGLTTGVVVVVVVAVVAAMAVVAGVAAAVTRSKRGADLMMLRKKTNKDTEAHHKNLNGEVSPLTQNTEGVRQATPA